MSWGDDDPTVNHPADRARPQGPRRGSWGDNDPGVRTDGEWSAYDMTGPADRAPRLKKPSLALGLEKGVLKPIYNGAMAVEAAATQAGVPTDRINHFMGWQTAREMADKSAADIVADPHRRPWGPGEVVGNIAGTIPVALATKNPWIGGAAQGALLTDARDPVGVGIDAGKGAAVNWFGGKAVEKVADLISPVVDPAIRRLADKGVKFTPGRVKGGKAVAREDRMSSRPFVGDAIAAGRQATQDTFNTAAVNEALAPLGKRVPTPVRPGHDSVAYAKDEIGRAYDAVIPHLSVTINGQQFAQSLAPVVQALPVAERKEFMRLVSLHLKNGNLSGQAIKDAQEALRTEASDYALGGPVERKLGRAFAAADEELTQAMMAQNPKWAPELSKVNAAYKGYRTVADAASRADDGTFNTSQFKQAVRRADRSKSKDASARGEAFMQEFSNDARSVIPARVPDSGTAGRTQAANLFANLGGAKDLAFYTADDVLQGFRLAPRPRAAAPIAKGVKRLARPVATTLVAASQQPPN